jgi:acetyl-CoA synthetase
MTTDNTYFPVKPEIAATAHVNEAAYAEMYQRSVADPEGFWAEQGKRLDWIKPYTKVKDVSFTGDVHIRWFYDGTLNVSYNCIDRHLEKRGDQATA